MTQGPLRMSLELDRGAQPISGRLCDERGGVRAFSGWLGLFAALEAAAADRPQPPVGSVRKRKGT